MSASTIQPTRPTRTRTEILEIRRHPAGQDTILAWNLDTPLAPQRFDVHSFKLSGWVLGAGRKVTGVLLLGPDGRPSHRLPLHARRDDAVALHPGSANDATCGFDESIGVLGFPPVHDLEVVAELEGGERSHLATVRVRHEPLRTEFEPVLQPLMLNGLGRSGSTWALRLLAEHPRIVAQRAYPYETRVAAWWMHAAKVLSEPTNLAGSNGPHDFPDTPRWIGNNPFMRSPMIDPPEVREWMTGVYPEALAAFFQLCCEGFYAEVAESQGQTDCRYFAEKHLSPSHLSWLIRELYPGAKEIFLVRDARDTIASILAFNRKRGFDSFGRDRADSDEQFVRDYREQAVALLLDWKQRGASSCLVRYEDLIREPEPTLRRVLSYLELDAEPSILRGMLERASRDTDRLAGHRTTRRPEESIGRWKRDLPPHLVDACHEALGDVLAAWGYEPDTTAQATGNSGA